MLRYSTVYGGGKLQLEYDQTCILILYSIYSRTLHNTPRRATHRICARLGLKGASVSKQTRHLQYDDPRMVQVRTWVNMMINTHQVEPKLMAHFDQVWTVHWEPAKKVLFKPREQAGVFPNGRLKPTTEQMLNSIRKALQLGGVVEKGDPPVAQPPKLSAQSTLVPVECQRNARTTTTLSYADGTMGRAYVTASQTVL